MEGYDWFVSVCSGNDNRDGCFLSVLCVLASKHYTIGELPNSLFDRRTLRLRFQRGFLILVVLAVMTIATLSCCERGIGYAESSAYQKETPLSVRSPIVEFSVDAETRSGDYIKATNEGGLIFLKGTYFKIAPWKVWYDKGRNAWIVLLVNVTSSNFRISYMFLRNGTGTFTLWHYDYESSTYDGYVFYGADYVKNMTCLSTSVPMPNLSIVPEAKCSSDVSALGTTLFIDDRRGLYISGAESLSLYPILRDASQIWFLMDDHQGRYYFSIFYLFETDREHILRAHTIRLNDLYQPSFETIAALWMPGRFPYSLTVFSDLGNVTVKINGFPFKTNELGRIEIRVPMGDITVEAQNEIMAGRGSRQVFSEWKWLTKSNPTFVRITQNTDLYLKYRTQFYLSLSSPYGSPIGEGWYDAGTTVRFSIEPSIDLSNRTRLMFYGWTGDQESSDFEGVAIVDKPKILHANWKRQYEIQISTKGLPSGVTVTLAVNENQTTVRAPFTHRQWVNADSSLMIKIYPTNLTASQVRYVFRRWQTEEGTPIILPATVRSPTQLIARYETEEPFTGKITLQVVPTTLLLENTVTIKGTTNPSRSLTNVTIFWSQDSVEWIPIATVTTDSSGNYEYAWEVRQGEKIYFKARWTYDPDYDSLESSTVAVTRIISVAGRQSQWPQFLNSIVRFFENAPVPRQMTATLLYPLIKISEIAMQVSAATRTPKWLQEVTTWVLAGALAGPIYLGPFLALLATAWKRATHRSPSARWLIILVIATAVGIGLMVIGQVLSASATSQMGLAIGTIAPSLLTAYVVALAIAKIT